MKPVNSKLKKMEKSFGKTFLRDGCRYATLPNKEKSQALTIIPSEIE
jgi:hypothetical protein